MTDNKPTLLELAGVTPSKLDRTSCALLLIDFQNEYTEGKLKLGEPGKQAIASARKLLIFARENNIPVIHVVQHGRKGGAVFNPDNSLSHIVDPLAPLANETVIVKTLPSAFDNTELDSILSKANINQLLVAGFMSHMCVNSTVRGGLVLGYKSIVCQDACATRDLPLGDAILPSEMVHRCSMAALNDRFATIMNTSDITKESVSVV